MQSLRRSDAIPLLLALPLVVALGPGCDEVFSLDRVPAEEALPNAYICDCTCFEGERDQVDRQFEVCAPPALNPNRPGGAAPSASDLALDCGTRVKNTLVSILSNCGSNTIQRRLEQDPSACACAPAFAPTFVDTCNGECRSIGLLPDCSNQMEATSVGALPPVCIAEPSMSGQRAMGRAVFGGRSICEVAGDLTVARGDDDPVSDPASGILEIAGGPCPGSSCDVEMIYRLVDEGSLGFDSYAGLASVEFRDIRVSGATLSTATLDGAGNGAFAESTLSTSGRGTREDEELLGAISDTDTASYIGANVDPVDVGVDWTGRQCALVGALLAAEIEGANTDIALDVVGTIVNQPPAASAGPDRNVECTSPGGATFTLTAAASSDPDGNIRFRDWWIGHPGGAPILDPDRDGAVSLAQALGTTATYALSVTDARMSVAQDSIQVSVEDTTAPTISALSASPTELRPLNHMMVPVTVSVATTDLCGAASCRITTVTSNQPINELGDGNTLPDWQITGALTVDLRAESSAVRKNRRYEIHVTCSDTTGNDASSTVVVTVPVNR